MSHFLDIQMAEETLRRACDGDVTAYEEIYAAFSKPTYSLIRRLVVRPAVAEELLQDVFVELLRSLSSYNGSGSFAGWVRSIAVNKALMYLRSPWHRYRNWLGTDALLAIQEQAASVTTQVESHELERALSRLPAITRSIVWLHDVEGYTHGEIARLFNRTTSFSKSQLSRAHEQLRVWLEPQVGGLACTPVSKN